MHGLSLCTQRALVRKQMQPHEGGPGQHRTPLDTVTGQNNFPMCVPVQELQLHMASQRAAIRLRAQAI